MKMKEIKLTQKRRSGYSTGLVLEAIGGAMMRPGVDFYVEDNDVPTYRVAQTILKPIAEKIIETMGYKGMFVAVIDNGIIIRSQFKPMYTSECGRCFEEVR